MCIITSSIATIATAIAVVATTATSAAVALSEVSAQKKVAAFEVEQAKKKAKKAEMEAAYARQEGVESARKEKLNAILSMANDKAKMAGGNIAMSSGLVLNMENENKINSELEALTTKKNAERKAQNYLDKSDDIYANAALKSFNNKLNTTTSYMKLGTSSLGAAI